MKDFIVTIILATYNRPDSLDAAIKSVLNQSLSNWKLFVIGDNCDNRTADVIKSNADSRIRYLNLPDRFGEQSGPNSVGLSLVNTKYVAYINHDDVWLADHLESGVNLLENGEFDFYIAGTATSRYIDLSHTLPEILVNNINIKNRNTTDFFKQNRANYEPASSWILKSDVAKKIGYWNYYTDIHRAPAEDYLLRAWRLNIKFYFSHKITTWAIITQYIKENSGKSYQYNSNEHKEVIELVISTTSNDMRSILQFKHRDWTLMPEIRKKNIINRYININPKRNFITDQFVKLIKTLILNKFTAQIYRLFGWDIFTVISILMGNKKGLSMGGAIKVRTGNIPQKPNLALVIERVKNEVYRNRF